MAGMAVVLLTPRFVAHYPALAQPKGMPGAEPRYSVLAVWRPSEFSDEEAGLWKAIREAVGGLAANQKLSLIHI